MNYESIRELRTVIGEEAVNNLLVTGNWHVIKLMYEYDFLVATLARTRA